jgi:hypothetical protein
MKGRQGNNNDISGMQVAENVGRDLANILFGKYNEKNQILNDDISLSLLFIYFMGTGHRGRLSAFPMEKMLYTERKT